MRKIIIYIIAIIYLSIDLLSFNLKVIDSYEISNNIIVNSFKYHFKYFHNKFYYTTRDPENKNLIKIYIQTKNQLDSLSINIKPFVDQINSKYFSFDDFVINENQITLLISNNLLFYDFIENETKLNKIINFKTKLTHFKHLYFNEFKLVNSNYYLMHEWYSSASPLDEQLYYSCYNSINDSINSKIFDTPSDYFYSIYQPKNSLDFSNNNVLFTIYTSYKIIIYNIKDGTTDTIKRSEPNWKFKVINDSIIKIKNEHKIISKIQSDTSDYFLIHRANFLNDSTIFVTYTPKTTNEDNKGIYIEYHDLWKKINNNWCLIDKDIYSRNFDYTLENENKAPIKLSYLINEGFIISFHAQMNKFKGKIIVRYLNE